MPGVLDKVLPFKKSPYGLRPYHPERARSRLIKSLPMEPRLAQNLPGTCSPPASASQVLGLQCAPPHLVEILAF
jgi:hypothetical protein